MLSSVLFMVAISLVARGFGGKVTRYLSNRLLMNWCQRERGGGGGRCHSSQTHHKIKLLGINGGYIHCMSKGYCCFRSILITYCREFIWAQNAKTISTNFIRENYNHNNVSVIFEGIALNLEKAGPLFLELINPCPLLSSIATDNRKQFQCPNVL